MTAAGTLISTAEAAGGVGGVTAFLTYRLKRREVQQAADKTMVDAAKSLTETSLALLRPVQEAAAKAEEQVKALRGQVAELEAAVQSLTDSLAQLTARSAAEREELLQQLAEMTAERDRYRDQLAANPGAVA